MTPPTAEALQTVQRTLAFQTRRVPEVRGFSGAIASLDDQRARAVGAFALVSRRLKKQGRPLHLEELRTVSEAAGYFFACHRREAWRVYNQHSQKPLIDWNWPSLNALLFRLCQES